MAAIRQKVGPKICGAERVSLLRSCRELGLSRLRWRGRRFRENPRPRCAWRLLLLFVVLPAVGALGVLRLGLDAAELAVVGFLAPEALAERGRAIAVLEGGAAYGGLAGSS
jgi:hypothetical protein